MTWNIHDTQKQRQGTEPGLTPDAVRPPPPGTTAATWDDSVALPTVLAGMQWEDGDEAPERYPVEMEQALLREGWVPQRLWDTWAKFVTRGVPSL